VKRFAIVVIPVIATFISVFTYLQVFGDNSWIKYTGLIVASGVGATIGVVINKVLFWK